MVAGCGGVNMKVAGEEVRQDGADAAPSVL
jgi:hypothetical protein